MGHTPGPWRLHKWGGDLTGDDTIDVLAAGDLEVCALRPTYDDNGQPERPMATILADARLIAAAPQLLAALNQVLDVLTASMDWQSGSIPGLEDAVELATKAINQAEGRSE